MYLIFISSLNENVKLANRIKNKLEESNKEVEIINLVHLNLPMYDTIKEQNDGIPQAALELAEKMKKAKGYIFVSPEYNFNVPPVLVNFIAWISRIGENFRALFSLKTIQLATHSGSNGKDFMNSTRNQFTKLGAIVAPREIITTYSLGIEEDELKTIIDEYIYIGK
ncbi:NADPH-dependent FMN reductase [Malaciobacter molluscorum]|uniref:NAD(P)H-dependent oxidoreductase n=1 Tax=Malaciobacter molluscorum TaxID=1032072 RepID=UPI00100A5BCD|nr:NAD(P)H-dependent oxidoreductase [Malaciobacter molluscorum]RXJ92044.1 NADPH-dependent FMN reductase [Malaciobacter molluscorum]